MATQSSIEILTDEAIIDYTRGEETHSDATISFRVNLWREITVIRPIIYMPERDCSSAAKRLSLPVCSSLCPANEHTERENMKTLLRELEKENKGLRERIFGAMVRKNIDGFGAFEREEEEK